MSRKKDKFVPIQKLSVENIYEEIAQYLKTRKSSYFEFDPKEPREEAIIRVFYEAASESLKNKLRKAIYICLERERIFWYGFEFVSRLLELVSEMRVTQVKNILLELARLNDFHGISTGDKATLKNQIIGILLEFDISKKALKDIIDNNIFDPDYTEICLSASTHLIPQFDSFIKYFPIALRRYLSFPEKVCLTSVLRVCLDRLGKDIWRARGNEFLFCDESLLKEILKLFYNADLEPAINPIDEDESSIEFLIKWPYDDQEIVSIYLYNLSDSQKEKFQMAVLINDVETSPIFEKEVIVIDPSLNGGENECYIEKEYKKLIGKIDSILKDHQDIDTRKTDSIQLQFDLVKI